MSSQAVVAGEAKELELVGKVELRIALASNDTKLESMLKTYLCPLLLKLTSEHISVRNKVISVCQHINTRIKSPTLKLPVQALLKQYKDCHHALVRHFDLLYIQQGTQRLAIEERLELLPVLIHGLSENLAESAIHTANMFNIFLRLLHQMKLPPRGDRGDQELRMKLGLVDRPQDAAFVARYLGKLILFTGYLPSGTASPGLTVEDGEFFQLHGKEDTWKPGASNGLNLTETKVVGAKFLASGAFTEAERFMPALFASADANSRLSDVGEDMLKRALPAISLEDAALIDNVYGLYLGEPGRQAPPRNALKIKILGLLGKSKVATAHTAEIVQIVREGLENGPQETGATKMGLELSKLRAEVFTFANWVAKYGTPVALQSIAPPLVSHLRDYIEGQGWPAPSMEESRSNAAEISSRSYGYESIGLLASASPRNLLLDSDLDLLRWLFTSLSGDNSGNEVSISIEQALSSVLTAFTANLDADLQQSLTNLLLHNMTLQVGDKDLSGHTIVRSTRYIAVRFSNRCLPFQNVKARWIDLLALAGGSKERNEVLEEGRRGLDPHWYRNLNPTNIVAPDQHTMETDNYQLPDWDRLVDLLFGPGPEAATLRSTAAFAPAVAFARCILFHEALASDGKEPVVDAEWHKNIDAIVANDETARENIKRYLAKKYGAGERAEPPLTIFMNAAFTGLSDTNTPDGSASGASVLELCSMSPANALDSLATRVHELRDAILGNKHTSRSMASHLFGLLAARPACPSTQTLKMSAIFMERITCWKSAIGSHVHGVHGSILAMAYWLSRTKATPQRTGPSALEPQYVELVMTVLKHSHDKELVDGAVVATGQLSLFGNLSPQSMPTSMDTSSLLVKLKDEAKAGSERAVQALGYFAMQCSEEEASSPLDVIFSMLYELHETRQAELQFAVGAALACAAGGWQSKSLIGLPDIDGADLSAAKRSHVLTTVLDKVLVDCKTTKPALRQASAIWLLCLLQYCGHLDEIQSRLAVCQVAFKGFLSDRESLNQETASRGLALVYEKGSRELKDDLVRDLVGSFTGSNAGLSGTVSTETQLFEPGALPTGENTSVTTYKDIMSLASEVGDSSLVYRFMSMASNNAIWSSRAAFGRFGLSSILSDSAADGYLASNPKLYPALYRYRFDPNANVRAAMNDIWAALVKEPAATVEAHFDGILSDLRKHMLAREWRTRQASCAAIADLLQGRPLEKYEPHLNEIWSVTFKVCDDIKESVRAAAMSLARVLTGILTRSLESGESSASTSSAMLTQVLPFLLSPSGLESSAKEVQMFALKTLLDIIKAGNAKVLRSFIPELVGRLLGLLSAMEPEAVNYIHMNAKKYGVTEQQLDDARLNSVRSSPMMEAIERCLDMLDEESMKGLSQVLEQATKTTIGLPSKVGLSRVLVSLSTRHNFLFKPYADAFLRLLRRQLLDRNDTISTSNAVASGYLCRISSDEEILRALDHGKKLYLESDDDRHRTIAGELIAAIAKHATDRFTSLAGAFLPFVFLGKHDIREETKTLFERAWADNVGGARAVLLYLDDVVPLVAPYLDSPRWSVKHAAAFTIADVVISAGPDMSEANALLIWPALEKAMAGKTWDGKEKVLEAFVLFAKNANLTTSDGALRANMQKIMLRESKRNNMQYRQHALASLGDFVAATTSIDWFEQVLAIVRPVVLDSLDDDQKMDLDTPAGGAASRKTGTDTTIANALSTLFRSVNVEHQHGPRLHASIAQVLELAATALTARSRLVLDAALDGLRGVFAQLATHASPTYQIGELDDLLQRSTNEVLFGADFEARVELSRLKAAEASLALAGVSGLSSRTKQLLTSKVDAALASERAQAVKVVLLRVRTLSAEGRS